MATKFTADFMATKLATLYPALPDSAARYDAWIDAHGPDWNTIRTYIETQTSLPFSDGWNIYWTT